jgi:hypothetical protein
MTSLLSIRNVLACLLIACIILPQEAAAQHSPDPDSPRARAITKFNTFLETPDKELFPILSDLFAPSFFEEHGDNLMTFIEDVRNRLEGFSPNGYRPIDGTTVGATHETSDVSIGFTFSVEPDAPFRLTAIKFDK